MKSEWPNSFPEPFLRRYARVFGEEGMTALKMGFSSPRNTWFRINTLKVPIDEGFAGLALDGIPVNRFHDWSDAGWVDPEHRAALLASKSRERREVYVQGMASQIPARMLDVSPGQRVLDLTAAPGSKTLQLAAMLSPSDELAAVELVRKRKFKLQDNLATHGADHVRVFHQDGTKVWRYRTEYFDRVLLDAPCSSEGRFRLDERDSYRYWSASKVKEMVRKQRRLLFSAVHALKPGGKLVYSTCALSPDENEMAIQHILNAFPDTLDIIPISFEAEERVPTIPVWRRKELDPRVSGACRLMPSERMEGFFVCALSKSQSSNPPER